LAIAVSHLSGGAAFIGKIRDDEFGRMLAAILRDNGVNDGGVVFDAGAHTTLAFVTLCADGEREFMFYRSPSADTHCRRAQCRAHGEGKPDSLVISLRDLGTPLIDPPLSMVIILGSFLGSEYER
jgi:sugar/nucleoside kinase (ribokinase family)